MTIANLIQLKELLNKYNDERLYIDLKFTDYGLIFEGLWNGFRFDKSYSYRMLSTSAHTYKFESLIDSFIDEFKGKINEGVLSYDRVKRSLIDSPEEEEAHWIETEVRGTPALICSSCGKDTGTIFEYDICPNCGKKMNKAATWRLKGGTDI